MTKQETTPPNLDFSSLTLVEKGDGPTSHTHHTTSPSSSALRRLVRGESHAPGNVIALIPLFSGLTRGRYFSSELYSEVTGFSLIAAGFFLASVTHARFLLSTPRRYLFPDGWAIASFFIAGICGLYGVLAAAVVLLTVLFGSDLP